MNLALELWEAARVTRCHTIPTIGQPQTLADHSYGVVLLAARLCPELLTAPFVEFLLYHDLPESSFGDLPAQTLATAQDLQQVHARLTERWHSDHDTQRSLSTDQQRVWSALDKIEFMFWCRHQIRLGNRYYVEPMRRAAELLRGGPNELTVLAESLLKETLNALP